ncbi:serine/threonine-protein kinase Sgk2-like [Liolophura sinensis]|uniref:serine/threonine-protein kinase Sgk2-like n=1 Tax=Liolophura sinensis TaxID=3198878 RepID=UPI003158D4EF
MGRRLRRFRHWCQRVVKITRRVFTVCVCGEYVAETKVAIVPVTSVLNGSIANSRCRHSGVPSDVQKTSIVAAMESGRGQLCSHSWLHRMRRDKGLISNPPRLITVAEYSGSEGPCKLERVPERRNSMVTGSDHSTEQPTESKSNVKLLFSASEKWAKILPSDVEVLVNLKQGHSRIDFVTTRDGTGKKFVQKRLAVGDGQREAVILKECQCDFVVKLMACFASPDFTYLYIPWYRMKDLSYWLQMDPTREVFNERSACCIMMHLLVAIELIHSIGVVHMDIKPANIFIDDRGYPVLADFGAAVRTSQTSRALCYTSYYASPEVRLERKADKMADLWSSACVFYEIVSNRLPDIVIEIEGRGVPMCRRVILDTRGLSPTVADFVSSQLRLERSQRLGFAEGAFEVMKHPIFDPSDWESVNMRSSGEKSPLMDVFMSAKGQVCEQNTITPSYEFWSPWIGENSRSGDLIYNTEIKKCSQSINKDNADPVSEPMPEETIMNMLKDEKEDGRLVVAITVLFMPLKACCGLKVQGIISTLKDL